MDAYAREWKGKVRFFTLDLGPNRELLIELGVSGLPSFLFFKNGKEKSYLAGKNTLLDEIAEHTEKLLYE